MNITTTKKSHGIQKKNDVKFIKINIKSTMNELRCEHIK